MYFYSNFNIAVRAISLANAQQTFQEVRNIECDRHNAILFVHYLLIVS